MCQTTAAGMHDHICADMHHHVCVLCADVCVDA